MPFKVTLGEGEEFLTDDLTLAEAIAIEKATGHSWYDINPFRSATDCQAIMVAFLSRTLSEDVAAKQVSGMSLKDVLASVDVVPDDRPQSYEDGMPDPKAVDESATTG